MFLELINNAFIDSSFYLYLGTILITFGVYYQLNNIFIESDYLFYNKHQNTKVNFSHMETFVINESIVIWLIITFKRIDEKDDKEDNSSSYFKNLFKIRGGQLWKETFCL
ncbi:hypothetical protein BEP19_00445 [Ammoniphilus oxalaticus]|uniref:Uncharacterized protein n=1 Tax=Ammoniphilus oxalaticus TaxID=66863 RepID=A0A419SRH5_9BACL|nr:hypothetical protein [Ammoniphilus oxalaticus]RKD27077.1 hypothetical protein BEP19_00445 [Ammoniphilus oxalaticus]